MAEMLLVLRLLLDPNSRRVFDGIVGTTGTVAKGNENIAKTANSAAVAVDNLGKKGVLLGRVFEAFILYKGFVFLKSQVELFISTLVNLEHQVALVQTQLNNLGKDFRPRITKEIMDIAKQTGVGFVELAKAEFNVVSANIEVADSFKVLELSAKAAVAGGLQQIDTAFQAALTSINAFNLGVSDFGRVFDLQFNLVKRGIFTYEQFANVAGEVSIAFAGMGQDIETTYAALAAVSQIFTGPQLSEGAVGLKNMALQISENVDRFEQFGVAVTDSRGNFRDLISILRDLEAALAGLSESGRASVLQELFQEKRAVRGVKVLLTELPELEKFFIEQKLAVGDLAEANKTMNETIRQQANIFRSELIPAVQPFVDMITALLGLANKLNKVLPGTTQSLLQLGIIGGVFTGIGLLGGGRFLTRRTSGFNVPTPFGEPLARNITRPTAAGGLLSSLVLLSQIQSGRHAERENVFTGLLGAAGTGAFTGAMLTKTPHGAAIGAAVGIGGFLFGLKDAMKKEGFETAKSFAQKFKEALEEKSDDIAEALAKSITKESPTSVLEALRLIGPGITVPGAPQPPMQFRPRPGGGLEVVNQAASDRTIKMDILQLSMNLRERLNEFERIEKAGGIPSELAPEAKSIIVAVEIQKALKQLPKEFQEAGSKAARFAVSLAESGVEVGKFEDILKILKPDDTQSIIDFFKNMAEKIRESSPLFAAEFKFKQEVSGNLKLAAEVFSNIGIEGASLADSFSELQAISTAFANAMEIANIQIGALTLGKTYPEFFEAVGKRLLEIAFGSNITNDLKGFFGEATPENVNLFIEALMGSNEQLDEFEVNLDRINNQMTRNRFQMERIRLGAELQNRDMTAEEIDQLKRLEFSNLMLEEEGFALKSFETALKSATESVESFGKSVSSGGAGEGVVSGSGSAIAKGNTSNLQKYGGYMTPQGQFVATNQGQYASDISDIGSLILKKGGVGLGSASQVANQFINPTYYGRSIKPFSTGTSLTPEATLGKIFNMIHFGESNLIMPSEVDLQSLRGFDKFTGGATGHPKMIGRQMFKFFRQMAHAMARSQERGGLNVFFNGPTAPSELDLSLLELKRLGPSLVRQRAHGR